MRPILRGVSLSKQILLALLTGVAVGLFFGERVAFLEIGGRAFVWIGVLRGNPRFASARRYWILGQGTRQKKPRWSVARDVLGWWKG